MDESLGALDKQLREQMQFEVKHIHERLGVTVVYVTHDQTEALTMSDRIAVFNNGVIQQLSTAEELYDKPQSSFVAQFIGENNRLSGTIIDVVGDFCRVQVASGDIITASNVRKAEKGDGTVLSIRPEKVEVGTGPTANANSFNAEVKELIFLGDHVRARLSVAGNEEFIVKIR
eukprot:gene49638-66494_t